MVGGKEARGPLKRRHKGLFMGVIAFLIPYCASARVVNLKFGRLMFALF